MFLLLPSLLFFSLFYSAVSDPECPFIKNPGEDRRINKSTMRIVQYNAEWLFIDHDSAFDCPGSQCTWKNIS